MIGNELRLFAVGSLTAFLLFSAPGHVQQLDVAIAADVSRSADQEEFELQRRGYAEAVTSPRFLKAVASGPRRGRPLSGLRLERDD